ncbi:MAG: O-antigen ligase family protein [Chlamydiales bacterium]
MSNKRFILASFLLVLLAILIPVEHKYDKLFRYYSLTLIPEGLKVSANYDKKIYFYISDLIVLALLCIVPIKRSVLWLLPLFALASIIASPFYAYPLPYIRLLQLFTPIALFSIVSTAFSPNERSKITRYILIAVVAGALFQSFVAIAQYLNQSPIGLRLLGESPLKSVFYIENGSRWLLDALSNRPAHTPIVLRAQGTFSHPNILGGFLFFSLLATYALWMQAKKIRWLLILALPIQFFAMSLSFSRSALFAWALSTLLWFGLMAYRNRQLPRIALLVLISFSFSAALLYKQYVHRGGVINYNALAKSSDDIRKFHQKTALKIIKDHPFFGLGFTQFSERSDPYFPPDAPGHIRSTGPHNMFLFLACETGLLSVAALLFCLASRILLFFKQPLTVETITFASLLLGFIFIGCCDFYPILFQQGRLLFFLIGALL